MGDLATRRKIGYLPELFRYQPWLKAREVLDAARRADRHGARSARRPRPTRRSDSSASPTGRTTSVGKFSKGMQQRLGLGAALLGEPALIVLDEPTSALDPVGRVDVRGIVRAAADRGAAVFLNSHLLSEVEQVCDRVAILDHGRVVAQRRPRRRARRGGDPGPGRRASAPPTSPAFERFGPPTLEGDLPARSARWTPTASRTSSRPSSAMGAKVHEVRLRAGRRSSSASSTSSPATGRRPARPAPAPPMRADRRCSRSPSSRSARPPAAASCGSSSCLAARGGRADDAGASRRSSTRAREDGIGELEIKFVRLPDPDLHRLHVRLRAGHDRGVLRLAGDRGGPRIGRRPGDARPAAASLVLPARSLARARDRDRRVRGRLRVPRDRRGRASCPATSPPDPILPIAFLAGQALVLLSLTVLLSTRLPPIAGGAIAVVAYGLAWMAGVLGKIGLAFGTTEPRDRRATRSATSCRPTRCGRASCTASSRRS